MNKITPILGVIAILVIGLVGYNAINGDGGDNTANRDNSSQASQTDEGETAVIGDIDLSSNGGTYTTFSDASLTNATARGDKTILSFSASWCPTCLSLDRNLVAGNIPDGVTILKLDFDQDIELRQKYGVNRQHTLVQVDEMGDSVKNWVLSRTMAEIAEEII